MLRPGLAAAAFALLLQSLASTSHGQQLEYCGDPPPVANESLKGEIEGEVQILSRFLGGGELAGQVQAVRKEIFSHYPDAEESRSKAYLEYQVCLIIMGTDKLSPHEKIDELLRARDVLNRSDPLEDEPRSDRNKFFTTQVASVAKAANGDSIALSLVIASEWNDTLVMSYIPESGFAMDNAGAFCEVQNVGGVSVYGCGGIFGSGNYTTMTPESKQTVLLRFRCDNSVVGDTIDVSATFCLRAEDGFPYTTVPVGISKIPAK